MAEISVQKVSTVVNLELNMVMTTEEAGWLRSILGHVVGDTDVVEFFDEIYWALEVENTLLVDDDITVRRR